MSVSVSPSGPPSYFTISRTFQYHRLLACVGLEMLGAVVKGFLIPSWNRTSFFLFLGRLGHAGSCGTNLEDVSMGVPGGLALTPFAFYYPSPLGPLPLTLIFLLSLLSSWIFPTCPRTFTLGRLPWLESPSLVGWQAPSSCLPW